MKKILVGLDGSKNAFKALEEGIRLAQFYQAELHTISVEEIPRFPETIDEVDEEKSYEDSIFKKYIDRAKEMAAAHGCKIEPHTFSGHRVKRIIEFINENGIDLLIVGFVGVSFIYDLAMGSTSSSLVRLAPCSVLIVK